MVVQTNTAVSALGLGAATGLRTMAALTAMFASEGTGLVLLPALGELIVDKLPATPARTRPIGLLARTLAAGFACAVLARRTNEDTASTVLLGVTAALVAAHAGAAYRRLVARAHIPDLPAALLEDALAYTTAFRFAT